jgi:hypothetical protein
MIKTPLTEMTSYQLFKETGFDVLTAVVREEFHLLGHNAA